MNREVFSRIKKIADRLKKDYHAEQVILFGSCARGEETVDSDIDLLIIAPTKERFFQRMASVLRIVRDLYSGLPISPIILRPRQLKVLRKSLILLTFAKLPAIEDKCPLLEGLGSAAYENF